jgi:hypothetical protein
VFSHRCGMQLKRGNKAIVYSLLHFCSGKTLQNDPEFVSSVNLS